MSIKNTDIKGLTNEEVTASRNAHGYNRLEFKQENKFVGILKDLVHEPMILLLLVTSCIYFIMADYGDAIFLAAAIILVAAISLYQDSRSRNALEKLKNFIHPASKVIRNGVVTEIDSTELVIGDYMMVEEGAYIPADGLIVKSNDFSVNESLLTGESMSIYKDASAKDPYIYNGTIVTSGLAIAKVTAIGNETKLGKIGKSLESVAEEKTPLEIQINHFVKLMVFVGAVVFIIVWIINYFHSHHVLDSLLKALTLAMSILPEEIPVAFTTFMALGAWRLMKLGVVVKQMKTVETLGSATVICTDKTGTLTENKMRLDKLYAIQSGKIKDAHNELDENEKALVRIAMWASEPIPFDPMEHAIHEMYGKNTCIDERPRYTMVHEYPIAGKPPMMTHIFENGDGRRIIAAKGAPEAIFKVSNITDSERDTYQQVVHELASQGYRVLGVGETHFTGNDFPQKQQQFKFNFKGLLAFNDPPKKNITTVLKQFYDAGIKVKIVTGDNAHTTAAIARQINFRGYENIIKGDELMMLDQTALQEKVAHTDIYSRMFPEAKLRIINALKANNEIVAMTGDGVNDGPALKAAHIGVAMGKKGSEIAKQAASLILVDDDLSKMVEAVAMGRKIYTNLKKAIQYIISIHIPIILTVFVPLALGWIYPNIFTPVHVIFMELIMGPTCSIIYENEPMEENTMLQKPRPFSNTFFNWKELTTSILQGLLITAGTLTVYQYAVYHGANELVTRTMVFVTLITANIFLTLVNRSFYYSVFTTLKHKNYLVPLIIFITVVITALLVYVDPLVYFFKFEHLHPSQLLVSVITGFISVIWYEFVKLFKRASNFTK